MNANSRLTALTRIGFATRGLLYLVIAFLILRTGRAEDPSGAIEYLGRGGGQILLGIIAVGLVAYGIWRLADAALDIERHGTDRKGVMERVGAGVSGAVHLFLAWQAVAVMRGAALSGDGTREGARTALQLPGGWALVLVGAVVLAALGAVQLVKATKGSFLRYLDASVARQRWVQWSGRAGYAARGLVFLISGYLLARAGIEEQAGEAGGMARVLSWLTNPFDLIVGAGLLAFGLFSLVEARYRRLHDVPVDAAIRRATSWH
ncbi:MULTISPECIES: DUF1206 domain-containing protein [unclassified Sphingomonas]|uniref:DUF1206 domain-containing protein n=1 Tax=unclassified Sphingomonas TaxID=196159 RepID=UPI0028614A1A|nr:DUF1206 domain-containing protein [Sphingomonas sp. SORGH_AS_0870]MDR6146034.1 hypothetical protein [Sphingomonas sp. SORGH_AS_0870]